MSKHLCTLKRALLFAMIAFAGAYAKASNDILVIDVNNVVPEIDHIREYLRQEQAQGRELDTKLVIVPSENRIPMETRRHIQDLHTNVIDPKANYYQENCTDSQMAASSSQKAKCANLIAEANAARAEADRLTNGSRRDGALKVEDVEQELAEVLRGPYQFSRVFISGHHSPGGTEGMISGELFSGFTSDIAKELLNSASSTQNVRSLIMLGCWTGREEMMRNAWGQVLPQAPYHSGFVEEAPLKTDPTNIMILDSILHNEKVIGESQTSEQLRESYSKLRIGGRKVAVMVKGMYISPFGFKSLQ